MSNQIFSEGCAAIRKIQTASSYPFHSNLPTTVPRVLVVVAHPDDEILWLGGMILLHPNWNWRVVSICRGSDKERSLRFMESLHQLGCSGFIQDLDDGPNQEVLPDEVVQNEVRKAVENTSYNILITHSPFGEYTRHRRHEEIGKAVSKLWQNNELAINEMWMFAYSDDQGTHYSVAIESADIVVHLPDDIWNRKCALLFNPYNFSAESFEVKTSPKTEAFWKFVNPNQCITWQKRYKRTPNEISFHSV